MKAKIKKKMDKIETIRTLILQRIEYHSNALDGLRLKLKRLDEVDAMLPDLAGVDGVNLADPMPGRPYASLNLTDAVKLALVHTAVSPKTLRELRDVLTRGGYPVPTKGSFSASLNATLHRLQTQDLITIAEDDDGRKTFVRKI
jgi:hypothetical protein